VIIKEKAAIDMVAFFFGQNYSTIDRSSAPKLCSAFSITCSSRMIYLNMIEILHSVRIDFRRKHR